MTNFLSFVFLISFRPHVFVQSIVVAMVKVQVALYNKLKNVMFSFSVNTSTPGVCNIRFRGVPNMEEWDKYAAAYRAALCAPGARFVLVFDLTELEWDMASVAVFAAAKVELTRSLKPVTIRVVQAVVVYTLSHALASIVTNIVASTDQASPFVCLADAEAVRQRVDNVRRLLTQPLGPGWGVEYVPREPSVRLKHLAPTALLWLVFVAVVARFGTLWRCIQEQAK
jgi:hypothetical protein